VARSGSVLLVVTGLIFGTGCSGRITSPPHPGDDGPEGGGATSPPDVPDRGGDGAPQRDGAADATVSEIRDGAADDSAPDHGGVEAAATGIDATTGIPDDAASGADTGLQDAAPGAEAGPAEGGIVEMPDAGIGLGDGGSLRPTVLATGEYPLVLALDADNVYWTNLGSGDIRTVPKAGGTPRTIASVANTSTWGVAVDATRVYWTLPNFNAGNVNPAVMSQLLDGGTPTTLVPGTEGAQSILVSGANAYWSQNTGPDAVRTVPVDGGKATTIATNSSGGGAIAADARNLYWSTTDGLAQEPLDGGPAVTIGSECDAIASDGAYVYYLGSLGNGADDGTVTRVPVGGGTPVVLATTRPSFMASVALDDRNVYWVEGYGTDFMGAVAAMPKAGGQVTVLASGLGDAISVVVDDSGIYFANPQGDGSIRRIAK
jgi:hypothetical protein